MTWPVLCLVLKIYRHRLSTWLNMADEQNCQKIFIKLAGVELTRNLTLDFWVDEGWYVGKLREVSGVFSQGESLEALKENIQDAYDLMMQETMITLNLS